ncbi:MAG: hypothetical protein SF162_05425 [bacterium]|nr:hypothetical protein [bacterium]
MMVYHWAQNFTVTHDDVDFLVGLLLEREIPLSTDALAEALIERKLADEATAIQERFKNVRLYNPSHAYTLDEQIVFPAFGYASGTITLLRDGDNPDYGPFKVMRVRFDGTEPEREFAAELSIPHRLADSADDAAAAAPWHNTFTAADILAHARVDVVKKLSEALRTHDELVSVAGTWFPRSLMIDVNVGYLNLAEAVLDMIGGGPLTSAEILDQIGGLGSADVSLQLFCLNHALNEDARFDEVGPVDQILWYLRREEPPEAHTPPPMLVYTPVDYDPDALPPEMQALEIEIDDEWSDFLEDDAETDVGEVQITLNYPHRRMGTLPLNAKMRRIFPTARRTPRIFVRLIDGQDQAEYVGWVVREQRYVFGLGEWFRKHKLPVGAQVTIRRAEEPGKIIIDFQAYKPRTEWLRIITPKEGHIAFEDQKRAIGAHYDELMLLGADDLAAVDALFTQNSKKAVAALAKTTLAELSRAAPQSAIHGKTLYSALNVLRRLPPGPIFDAMIGSPDFEYMGNNYWKLSGV